MNLLSVVRTFNILRSVFYFCSVYWQPKVKQDRLGIQPYIQRFIEIFILYFRSELECFLPSAESEVETTGSALQGGDGWGPGVRGGGGGQAGGSPVQHELALAVVLPLTRLQFLLRLQVIILQISDFSSSPWEEDTDLKHLFIWL